MRVLHTRRHPTDPGDLNPRSSLISGSCCFWVEPFLEFWFENFLFFFVDSTGGSVFLISAFLVFVGLGKLVLRVSSLGLAISDDKTILGLSETSNLSGFIVVDFTSPCVGIAGLTKGLIYKIKKDNYQFAWDMLKKPVANFWKSRPPGRCSSVSKG